MSLRSVCLVDYSLFATIFVAQNVPQSLHVWMIAEGGTDNMYYRRHNPLIDFTDVCPGTGQDQNIVPYSQMATDFAQGNTVNYEFITRDVNGDAHNGTLQAADQRLQNNLPVILAQPEFSPGGDGILFIVWDEGDNIYGGAGDTTRSGEGQPAGLPARCDRDAEQFGQPV